jgi:hypothetical protein
MVDNHVRVWTPNHLVLFSGRFTVGVKITTRIVSSTPTQSIAKDGQWEIFSWWSDPPQRQLTTRTMHRSLSRACMTEYAMSEVRRKHRARHQARTDDLATDSAVITGGPPHEKFSEI